MITLDAITTYLLNPYTGTILFVIALGYLVRAMPFITNKWIPFLGISFGSLFFLIIAPITIKPDPEHSWNWYVMIWGIGLILSAFAWLIHLIVISRLEDYVRTKIPAVDVWFRKTSDSSSKSSS
jgi:threonine/homoserine/homoserine lactone efflux protein